ncbi:MAG: cysteine desulfurase [Methanocellales archaeon]|nr:cysteine desulfurase [Methanocellales archaeon]MDD3421130.1 cysteine desulfurase [Methanocellales archaeon]MDD4898188.1 cysteine desulfurase [Methanocellales archaeon]MDD5446987.1 cysteine desulfurase [Methanocellales archaeon]
MNEDNKSVMFRMNVENIRKDFPILDDGLIYMDSAATSLTPESVVASIQSYYRDYNANVGRGVHRLSQVASQLYEGGHTKIADFINAKEEEIVFTKNTTEGINLVASGLGWKRGDKIVTSILEHHSNLMPWLRVKKKFGVNLEIVKPKNGVLSPEDVEKVVDDKTKLVALTHVSNVLGLITPIKEIAKVCEDNNAFFLVDGAQSVPHLPVDVKELGCDFLAFSGHKMLGPTGTGVLFIRMPLLESVEPLTIGGGTINDVSLEGYKLKENYERFEAGTPNVAGGIALGRAVEYLEKIGMNDIRKHEEKLTKKFVLGLKEIKNVEILYPNLERRIGVISFNIKGLNPHDVALMLDNFSNIMVRSGYHCCMPLIRWLGVNGAVRVSLYLYNTEEEVETLLGTIEEIARG